MSRGAHPVAIAMMSMGLLTSASACATFRPEPASSVQQATTRGSVLARAQVWTPTNVRSRDLKRGPRGRGAFPFMATVDCTYVDKPLHGRSPKFLCESRKHDQVLVKYGVDNGEVYGEVLATRLLWALGFGADRVYPVVVVCHGCPPALGGVESAGNVARFDTAVIKRRSDGSEWPRESPPGWWWNELNVVTPAEGGAPRAHRDALKLLAVFLQHTDSKPEQQRILCRPSRGRAASDERCRSPFLMISDVGLTFGRASAMNTNEASSVNLLAWRRTPIWKGEQGCVANLPRSLTGSLDNPVISEDGRRFLARLLGQLSNRQLRDLFEAASVQHRLRSPGQQSSGLATIAEWVEAFKEKRDEIASRRCS